MQGEVNNITNKIKAFTDCKNKKGGQLFIAEGNSAAGSLVLARDSDWQAVALAVPGRGRRRRRLLHWEFQQYVCLQEVQLHPSRGPHRQAPLQDGLAAYPLHRRLPDAGRGLCPDRSEYKGRGNR